MRLIPDFDPVFRVWHHHQKGHLPGVGGILDQPAILMDQLELIGRTLEAVRQEKEQASHEQQ
ncbi:hypothetical protein [Candidatus Magnetaquiglobus chichijimensis]|uniref:hypothetical protein n=1 Tax=Candidatus Magnetaquiglobus chichijimensis TaxID=3141448 RepID=UPI003B975D29